MSTFFRTQMTGRRGNPLVLRKILPTPDLVIASTRADIGFYIVPRHFEVAAYCKKTAKNFLYFTDDTYKSVLFTTACSFLFHQSNRLDKGGVRGCAKRRAAIDSAQDWTDQAKHLSSESFLLCIPLDALLTAVYSCLLTTKNGERTAPTTVRPLSIHQTNSMSAKKQVLL